MPAVAKLSTIATLDATQFKAGMASMQTSLSAFSSFSLGAFASIGSKFVGFVRSGIEAIPRFTMAGLELGHSLKIASLITGIAAEKISTYHRAVRLAGMGAEEFDLHLARMNETIGEGIMGSAKIADMLSHFGLTLKSLATLSPEETFLRLADAISKTKSAYDRATLAKMAFGMRSGFQMLPLLSGGRGAFTGMGASTRALGAAPDNAQIETMSKARMAVIDLTTAFEGLKYQLADWFAPIIQTIAEKAKSLVEENKPYDLFGEIAGNVALVGGAALGMAFGDRPYRAIPKWYPYMQPDFVPSPLSNAEFQHRKQVERMRASGRWERDYHQNLDVGPLMRLEPSAGALRERQNMYPKGGGGFAYQRKSEYWPSNAPQDSDLRSTPMERMRAIEKRDAQRTMGFLRNRDMSGLGPGDRQAQDMRDAIESQWTSSEQQERAALLAANTRELEKLTRQIGTVNDMIERNRKLFNEGGMAP